MPVVVQNTTRGLGNDSEKRIRQQLGRILNSATFREAGRLKRFIDFIVSEALAGRADQLKEYVVGVQVFEKKESFDPRTDPIVRVQARRLRIMLERYYRDEGYGDELLIDLPKGGYGPVFKFHQHSATKASLGVALVSRNTIAVLPFSDYSPQSDLGYFCNGMGQEIISTLSNVPDIRVLAWHPAKLEIGIESTGIPSRLNAAIVITGSVRKSAHEVRIAMQIIDGATGCYLWSDTVEGQLEKPFAIQKEVARLIVAKVQGEITKSAKASPTRRSNENLAARNLYIQGRYHMDQRTEEGLRKAVEFLEKALVEDPNYALAHSGLANAYGLLAHYGVLSPSEVWTKTASNAAAAVMLDDKSAEAHTSLAHVKATQDWDFVTAEHQYQQAISLDPGYPTAHHWYAMTCLSPLGRLDDALDEMLIAQSLDPVSSIIARDVAVIYCYRREFDAALEQCDHTIELNPHFSATFWTLGLIQEQRRDFEEADAAFQRAIHLSPESPRMHGALGRLHAICGKRKLGLEALHKLQDLARYRYVSPFEFASIHFALGQADLAFEWFTKARQDRAYELLSVNVDPRFDSLRQDHRFISVANQLGLAPVTTEARLPLHKM